MPLCRRALALHMQKDINIAAHSLQRWEFIKENQKVNKKETARKRPRRSRKKERKHAFDQESKIKEKRGRFRFIQFGRIDK